MSFNFQLEIYDKDNPEVSPVYLKDRRGEWICTLKASENTEEMIDKLDKVYEAGVAKGRRQVQAEVREKLGLDF